MLLEELDNNVEMTTEILEEECGKSFWPDSEKCTSLSSEEENKLLKKAVARLYKKVMMAEKELE